VGFAVGGVGVVGIELKEVGGAVSFFIFFTIVIDLLGRPRRRPADGGRMGGFFSDRVRSMTADFSRGLKLSAGIPRGKTSFNESSVSPFEEEQEDPPLASSSFRAVVGVGGAGLLLLFVQSESWCGTSRSASRA